MAKPEDISAVALAVDRCGLGYVHTAWSRIIAELEGKRKRKIRPGNQPTTADIELAVASWFNWRRNLIVPNVAWGLFPNRELDLMILTPSDYAYEVEIKVTKQDLARDAAKPHGHRHKKIKRLYFAIPERLLSEMALIPEHAGILSIYSFHNTGADWRVRKIRDAKNQKGAEFLPQSDRQLLLRLGALRIWTLKRQLADAKYQLHPGGQA